jgi:hypothetical protein
VLLPKEEGSCVDEEGQSHRHPCRVAGGEAIDLQVYEGPSFRRPDSGSFAAPQGSQGEAVTWEGSTGSVGTAEK